VLQDGYRPDTFLDGPLLTALREGSLLYIEGSTACRRRR
jgi:MoxR-like ATPase